jgi:serine/threonine protein kinase
MIDQTISHYKILEKLGEGGMGIVYKAQDTNLDRFVALKFLPAHLAASEEDKARFIQEAKAASALNHPNVCTIHDIAEHDGQLFIVMEFVDGKSLKEKKENLSEKQILDIGIQVAEGLAAAHERGIVHRDIKPENIMIRKDGIVQIMDFGLAKLYTSGNASRLTKAGTTMGTIGYMSPEQVQGLDVDHRTDLFSLGVVLYELFSGQSPFKGVHETAIMYEIVHVDPAPIATVKEGIDPQLDDIILECLEKEKDDRCQSAKELAKDLRKIRKSTGHSRSRAYRTQRIPPVSPGSLTGTPSSESTASGLTNQRIGLSGVFRSALVPWSFAAVFALALLASWLLVHRSNTERVVTKFQMFIGDDNVLDTGTYPALAISHDGTKFIFRANNRLFLRKMDSMEPTVIPGIEGVATPFFSPDDKWIGFFRNGKLEKISLSGGTPVTLTDAQDNRGATWSSRGFIIFSPTATTGLSIIPENGGVARQLTVADSAKGERTHRWPSCMPDGKHVLFTLGMLSNPDYYENATIEAVDIETGQRKVILRGASTARYISSGHLLFSRSGVLYVVAFDADKLEVRGQPVPVVEGVYSETTTGITNYVVAENGTLAYLPGAVEGESRRIVKIDMKGFATPMDSIARPFMEPKLSPDNKKVAVVIRNGEDYDIWIFDVPRKTLSKLTFGGLNRTPVWSPDGKTIAFSKRTKDGKSAIFTKPYDGSGDETELYSAKYRLYLNFWTRDGKYLIIDYLAQNAQSDLLVLPLTGDKKPWMYLESPKDEYESSISPDGKWVTYLNDESGSYQIYVRSFPNKEGKWQISTDVAEEPRWSPDGKTIYYRKNSQIMAVPVSTATTFSAGLPTVLFSGFPAMNVDSGISYDITADGKYFVTTQPLRGTSYKNIVIAMNWVDEIKNLTSVEK